MLRFMIGVLGALAIALPAAGEVDGRCVKMARPNPGHGTPVLPDPSSADDYKETER
jgi:hypothetical protein